MTALKHTGKIVPRAISFLNTRVVAAVLVLKGTNFRCRIHLTRETQNTLVIMAVMIWTCNRLKYCPNLLFPCSHHQSECCFVLANKPSVLYPPDEEAVENAVHLVPRAVKHVLVAAVANPVAMLARLVPVDWAEAPQICLHHVDQVEDDARRGSHHQSVSLHVGLLLYLGVDIVHPDSDKAIKGKPHDDVEAESLTHPNERPAKVCIVEGLGVGGEGAAGDGGDDGDVEDAHQQVGQCQHDEIPAEGGDRWRG